MKKIIYLILSLCLCTAGIGTAAHFSPSATLGDALTAVNDTVEVEEEIVDGEDDEDEDTELEADEIDEDDEDAVDNDGIVVDDEDDEELDDEEEDEDDEELDDEEDDEDDEELDDEDDDEDEDEELDDEEDEDDDDDFGFFSDDEDDDEFGEMHDDDDDDDFEFEDDDEEESISDADIELTEGMRISAEEQMEGYNAQTYLSESQKAPRDPKAIEKDDYISRLRRLPAVIEMPYNDIVRQYIDRYANRMRRSVSIMLGAQNFYNPIFEEALEAEGCPLELKYLPVIESAYNPSATSPVGAAGLWQFMPSTGKSYGLEVNSLVDERRDPIKSSYAAARHLRTLHDYYDDWTLALAAYNCGAGNVNKAIQRSGGSKDYWAIYNHLPKETRGYVPAFIAANYIMQYYCEHGIEPLQAKLPAETDTIMVSRDLHLKQVADLCDVSLDQLKELNPQYRTLVVPGYWKPCIVRLPGEAVSKFIACGDSIYSYQASELLPRRSTTTIGTSTTSTARTATKPVSNGYSKTSSYNRSSSARSTTPKATATPKASSTNRSYNRTYTKPTNYNRSYNKSYTKSNNYNRTYTKSGSYNKSSSKDKDKDKDKGKDKDKDKSKDKDKGKGKGHDDKADKHSKQSAKHSSAKSGHSSKQPAKGKQQAKSKKTASAPSSVTIRKGDNLSTIAKRHGTTVTKLKKLNGMKGNETRIHTGKKLKVK